MSTKPRRACRTREIIVIQVEYPGDAPFYYTDSLSMNKQTLRWWRTKAQTKAASRSSLYLSCACSKCQIGCAEKCSCVKARAGARKTANRAQDCKQSKQELGNNKSSRLE
jgi:hypothetical protein